MSLKVWLPLTGNLENKGLDDVTVTVSGTTSYTNGKIGQGLSCNGSSYWSVVGVTLGSEASIACWAKTTASGKMPWVLVSTSSNILNLYTNSNYTLNTGDGNSNLFKDSSGNSIACLNDGNWHHLTVTFGSSVAKLYIDGVYRGTAITFKNPTTTSAKKIKLAGGYNDAHTYDWNGVLNDFRVYDHCLSPMEVKQISQGLILHYPLNRNSLGQENLISNSQLNGSWTYPSSSYSDKYAPTTLVVPSGSTYVLSFDAKSTVNGDKIRTHYYSPNTTTTCTSSQGITKNASDGNMDFTLSTSWKRYWVVYNQSETTAVKHIICPRLYSGQGTGTVSVRNVKFEEGSIPTTWCPNSSENLGTQMGLNNNIIYDTSGYNNNGTIVGTLNYVSDTPRYNVSTKFNGQKIIRNVLDGEVYTISCWAKTSKNKSTTQLIVADSKSQMAVGFYQGNVIGVIGTTRSTGSKCVLDSNYKENEWNHFVVVKTGTSGERSIYCNNVLLTPTSNDYFTSVTGFYVGARNSDTPIYFYGQISDIRFYATALSAEDIQDLYNLGASIDTNNNLNVYEVTE